MNRKQQTEQILIGACEVYMTTVTDGQVPADNAIETEANNVGHTSGGTSVEYMPEKHDVKNSYGEVVKSRIKTSKATIKFGLLNFDLELFKMLNNAKLEYGKLGDSTVTWGDATQGATHKRLRFNSNNPLDTVLVRLVHTKDDGKKVRVTMFGQGGNGFTADFGESEVVANAQIDSVKKNSDFILEIVEEIMPKV